MYKLTSLCTNQLRNMCTNDRLYRSHIHDKITYMSTCTNYMFTTKIFLSCTNYLSACCTNHILTTEPPISWTNYVSTSCTTHILTTRLSISCANSLSTCCTNACVFHEHLSPFTRHASAIQPGSLVAPRCANGANQLSGMSGMQVVLRALQAVPPECQAFPGILPWL